MRYYNSIAIVLFCMLLVSCNGGGNECSIYSQNRFVHELLLDEYFWYQDIEPTLNYSDFDSPEETLDFLKVEADRFSYITDAEAFYSLFNDGQTIKFGFSFLIQSDNSAIIRYVFDDSPAGRSQLQRGDQIISVNNQSIEEISNSFGWGTIFGPDEVGYPVDMVIQKINGDVVTVHMEKSVVNINTVLHHSVIQNGSDTVGYLVFNSFISTGIEELSAVFDEFKAAEVNKMILDLRYNGGGSVAVAQYLASLMVVNNSNSDVFTLLKHNDKYQDRNRQYSFITLPNELALDQVTIITTGATASASEMLINGLKPFVEVNTVGSTTFGKPVGMYPTEFCNKVILPISFSGFNQDGEGEFFDGIAADCSAEDDPDFDFGDSDAPMLNEALYVSRNNRCSTTGKSSKGILNNFPKPSYSLQDIIGVY